MRNDITYEVTSEVIKRTPEGIERRTLNPGGEYILDPGEELVRVWSGDTPPLDWTPAESVGGDLRWRQGIVGVDVAGEAPQELQAALQGEVDALSGDLPLFAPEPDVELPF